MSVFLKPESTVSYSVFYLQSNTCVPLQAWRAEGLPLSTSSNEACKLYDAILTQVTVHSLNTCIHASSFIHASCVDVSENKNNT